MNPICSIWTLVCGIRKCYKWNLEGAGKKKHVCVYKSYKLTKSSNVIRCQTTLACSSRNAACSACTHILTVTRCLSRFKIQNLTTRRHSSLVGSFQPTFLCLPQGHQRPRSTLESRREAVGRWAKGKFLFIRHPTQQSALLWSTGLKPNGEHGESHLSRRCSVVDCNFPNCFYLYTFFYLYGAYMP